MWQPTLLPLGFQLSKYKIMHTSKLKFYTVHASDSDDSFTLFTESSPPLSGASCPGAFPACLHVNLSAGESLGDRRGLLWAAGWPAAEAWQGVPLSAASWRQTLRTAASLSWRQQHNQRTDEMLWGEQGSEWFERLLQPLLCSTALCHLKVQIWPWGAPTHPIPNV